MKSLKGPLLFAILLLGVGHAHAAMIELTNASIASGGYSGGGGYGRGIGFTVNQAFSIDSIGIDINVLQGHVSNTWYEFEVYSSSDGHTAGSLLYSSIPFNLGYGAGWQDAALSYSFNQGDSYVINFSRIDNTYLLGLEFIYRYDGDLPDDYGVLTLVEGFEGSSANNYGNFLHPSIRINTTAVPLPAAVWLFGSGLLGLAGLSRRKPAMAA